MHVARARRRLIAARRAVRAREPWKIAPRFESDTDPKTYRNLHNYRDRDSPAARRIVQLLARRKYFSALRVGYQNVDMMYDENDNCYNDPPCANCHRCFSMMMFHYAEQSWGRMLSFESRQWRGSCRIT